MPIKNLTRGNSRKFIPLILENNPTDFLSGQSWKHRISYNSEVCRLDFDKDKERLKEAEVL